MSDSASAEKTRVFLEADSEIRGQKYVCLSFLTPNRGILRNKDLFFFHKFMEFYALDHKVRTTEGFVLGELRVMQEALSNLELTLGNADVTDASGARAVLDKAIEDIGKVRSNLAAKVPADIDAHVKSNLSDYRETKIVEAYDAYMASKRQALEDEFHKLNNFQTTIHGLKVRGVYSTHEQATARAKALHKTDPYFNVFVADVGEWLPWDPEPDDVQDGEYQCDELNKLMKGYKENMAQKDAYFEEEKRAKLADAAAAAMKAKSGTPAPSTSNVSSNNGGSNIFDEELEDPWLRRKQAGGA